MEKDEKNLDGGQAKETTTGTEETTTVETPASTDPLDSMSEEGLRGYLAGLGEEIPEDTEDVLAYAKERRAIKNRHAKKDKGLETSQPSKADDGDAVKRFEKANERRAIRTIESSEDESLVEINENWDEIVANYIPRRGKDTEEDILDDIMDAHAIWKRKQTVTIDTKEAESEISQTHGTKGKSPLSQPVKKEKIIKPAKKMGDWYKD